MINVFKDVEIKQWIIKEISGEFFELERKLNWKSQTVLDSNIMVIIWTIEKTKPTIMEKYVKHISKSLT